MAELNKTGKPQVGPYNEGVLKALKRAGEEHANEAIQQGVPPSHIEKQAGLSTQDVLAQLQELSQMQVPVKDAGNSMLGNKVGLTGAITNALSGKGFNPLATKTEPLGLSTAAQILGLKQSLEQGAISAEKAPYELEVAKGKASQIPLEQKKLRYDTAKAAQDLKQSDPSFKLNQLKAEEEIRMNSAVLTQNLKNFSNEAKATYSSFNGFNSIEKSAIELGDFNVGVISQAVATGEKWKELFAKNPKYIKYRAAVSREVTRFARIYGQEKGMVSDKDIKRYENTLPDPTAPLQLKIDMLHEIKAIMKKDLVNSAEIAGINDIGAFSPNIKFSLDRVHETPPRIAMSKSTNKMFYVYSDGSKEEIS